MLVWSAAGQIMTASCLQFRTLCKWGIPASPIPLITSHAWRSLGGCITLPPVHTDMLRAHAVKLRVRLAAPQLRAKDVEIGVLRASPSRLALMRSWDVDLQQVGVSFKVNGSAGVTYQGAGVTRV